MTRRPTTPGQESPGTLHKCPTKTTLTHVIYYNNNNNTIYIYIYNNRRVICTHHRMRDEDLGLVAIVLLLHFLSRDRLEADLHHVSGCVCVCVCVPAGVHALRPCDDSCPPHPETMKRLTSSKGTSSSHRCVPVCLLLPEVCFWVVLNIYIYIYIYIYLDFPLKD